MAQPLSVKIIKLERLSHLDPGLLLATLSTGERAKFAAIVSAVSSAPIGTFSGGGYWQALRGELSGLFEVRFQGKPPWLYRFFCHVEMESSELYIFAGARKKKGETLSAKTYAEIRSVADELTN